MTSKPPSSLQEIIKQRQEEEFVGRQDHVNDFKRNLSLPLQDRHRRFVYSISGQAGVGKSFLLRHLRQVADQAEAVTTLIDEAARDVPSAMGLIAAELDAKGYELKNFANRFKVYRQRRQELESDPEAPKGLANLIGRAIGKGGVHLARRIPVGGVAFEMVGEEDVANVMGDIASYVTKRITNKDEVQLVLRPDEILTPLFIQDLGNVASHKAVGLFFDTYERTSHFLDTWLRDILEGRYGTVSPNVLFIIGGQHELDRNQWAPYEALVGRFSLELFTEDETREYLRQKGIIDKDLVDVILHLSGRLPLLVATLAAEPPSSEDMISDPTETAVKRFFKWVDEPKKRQIALDCSLPRYFNRDVVAAIAKSSDSDSLFDWLIEMPFVLSKTEGWVYHNVAREQMLRQKKHETPQGWEALQQQMASFYKEMQQRIGVQKSEQLSNEKWQSFRLEELYHRLCNSPEAELYPASVGFVSAFETDSSFALQWGHTIHQAGHDVDSSRLEHYGQVLVDGVKAFAQKNYENAATLFTFLLEKGNAPLELRHSLFSNRGILSSYAGLQVQALKDLDEAIKLSPNKPRERFFRGVIQRSLGRNAEALDDLNKAIDLAPNIPMALLERARVLRSLSRFAEAKTDLERVIELDSGFRHAAFKEIGQVTLAMNEPAKSADAFVLAIDADPICSEAWNGLIASYQMTHARHTIPPLLEVVQSTNNTAELLGVRASALGRAGFYEEALSGFNRAINLSDKLEWLYLNRGFTLYNLARYQKALEDYNAALSINAKNSSALSLRAEIYAELGRCEDSLADYDRMADLDGKTIAFFYGRALTYRRMERFEDALSELDSASVLLGSEALAEERAEILRLRGDVLQNLKRFDEALDTFDQAVTLKDDAVILASRAKLKCDREDYNGALADVNKAIELDDRNADAFFVRSLAENKLGLHLEAMKDIRRSVELSPINEHRAQVQIGHIFSAMGKPEKAVNAFKKALFDYPDCSDCWLSLAAALQEIHSESLVPTLLRAVSIRKDQPASFLITRGAVLGHLGYLKEAMGDLGIVLSGDENNVRALEKRAKIHLALGNYDRVLADLQRAQKVDSESNLRTARSLGSALSNLGRFEEALNVYKQLASNNSSRHLGFYGIAVTLCRWKGLPAALYAIEEARKSFNQIKENIPAEFSYGLAGLEALLGNKAEALKNLQISVDLDESLKTWAAHDLAWQDLRTLPEFSSLLN